MATDPESLRERIASAESMQSIVETMRTLALVNIRRAEQAVAAAAEYLRAVHIAVHIAIRRYSFGEAAYARPAGGRARSGPPALLVLSSNQGLCGAFNERVVEGALGEAARIARRRGVEPSDVRIVCVGYRGADRLSAAGCEPVRVLDAPSSIEAVRYLVGELYLELNALLSPDESLLAVYNGPAPAGGFETRRFQLLPIDAERFRRLPPGEPPFRTLPKLAVREEEDQATLAALVRELLYIDLYRALVESFAAENAARLSSMQGASDNIEERLEELQAAYREARQDAVTHELMDILAGIMANE